MNNSAASKIQQEFNNQLKEVLSNEVFNCIIDPLWANTALDALRLNTPVGLGITAKEYQKLFTALLTGCSLDCYMFAVANNNLENKTPKDLGIQDINTYFEVSNLVEDYARMWTEQTEQIRGDLIKKLVEPVMNGNGVMKRVD